MKNIKELMERNKKTWANKSYLTTERGKTTAAIRTELKKATDEELKNLLHTLKKKGFA